ncbi:MAG: STAS domain-containing protein [Butyricicoccus sp.]|nr:STAS domain-containing protein [Butyricicoccus sp.]
MNIRKAMENEQIVLNLNGRLDTTTAPDFQQSLLEEIKTGKNIILDFSELAYVSSAGLRSLLTGQKAVAAGGQTMVLRHVSEEIMEVFDMTGFSDILTIETA